MYPATPQAIGEVAHIESGSDIFQRIKFSPGVEHQAALVDELRCQGNISRNHQITGF